MMTVFCAACASTLTSSKDRDPAHVAAFVYGGAIARAIVRLKFEGRPDLARPLANALLLTVRVTPLRADIVIPVPLYPHRLVERGFNQAALLAAPVARELGARFLPMGLERSRDTGHQAALDRAARGTNVLAAFRARRPESLCGQHVLLVDDVRTSGATLEACGDALLSVGAKEVRTLVLAQTEERDG